MNAKGRRCLVVGGGPAAVMKVDALLQSGINVRVVAKEATEPMRLRAESKLIELHLREYRPQDLEGILLVIAATNDPELNQSILIHANCRNLFVNTVDEAEHCDFCFPAVLKRGPLQVGISTSGESPTFAQRLKVEIDSFLPNHLGDWLAELGKVRRTVLHSYPSGKRGKIY